MSSLDERALRRPDFKEGVPIRLADGQEWSFPRPWLELCPVPAGGNGHFRMGGVYTLGTGFDDWMDRIESAEEGPEIVEAMFGLAAVMLGVNYGLGPKELSRLLRWRQGDEENLESWKAVLRVARGSTDDVPKPDAVGSAPSSSPTASPAK